MIKNSCESANRRNEKSGNAASNIVTFAFSWKSNLIKKLRANGKPLKHQINKDYKVSQLSRVALKWILMRDFNAKLESVMQNYGFARCTSMMQQPYEPSKSNKSTAKIIQTKIVITRFMPRRKYHPINRSNLFKDPIKHYKSLREKKRSILDDTFAS
jgi:hypothetical protein